MQQIQEMQHGHEVACTCLGPPRLKLSWHGQSGASQGHQLPVGITTWMLRPDQLGTELVGSEICRFPAPMEPNHMTCVMEQNGVFVGVFSWALLLSRNSLQMTSEAGLSQASGLVSKRSQQELWEEAMAPALL